MSKLTALLGVDIVAESKLSGWHVDSVGVKNLVEGDTINLDAGLTIIETMRIFPREVDGGEVFALGIRSAGTDTGQAADRARRRWLEKLRDSR